MSPSKMNVSNHGMQTKLRKKEGKPNTVSKVKKDHERIGKEKPKVRKIKKILKKGGMKTHVEDAKKLNLGKKMMQGKKKGQILKKMKDSKEGQRKESENSDDEYVTEEDTVMENSILHGSDLTNTETKGIQGKKKRKVERKKGKAAKKGQKKETEPLDDESASEEEPLPEDIFLQVNESVNNENSDSIRDGRDAFTWLIAPIKIEDFFQKAWEKAPLHVKRTDFPDYYKAVLSSQKINDILRDNYVTFSKNIDITSYRDGKRETHNPTGRAVPSVVWDFYKSGCSVRMLNPQTFCTELRKLTTTLQDFFGCFVGANSYLTPANSQGFAPHYDDIEAFILQIEGKKHWKVYAPREREEVLPRFSSPNFSQDELKEPVLEVTLQPGDLLYFPRGFIHQASTEPGHHSLHVTVSCYQRNSWGDLFEKLLPAALAMAQEEDVEYRRGLPLDYLRFLGVSNCDQDTAERKVFFAHLQKLFTRLWKHLPVDAAVDQLGKQFMHDALPPVLTTEEEECCVFSEDNIKLKDDGTVLGKISLNLNTKVKLIRSHILRLVKEDLDNDSVQVYHCVDNSLEYHGEEPQMFEVTSEFALAIEKLLHSYPEFTPVSGLELETAEDRLELANLLWKRGLLLTEKPIWKKSK